MIPSIDTSLNRNVEFRAAETRTYGLDSSARRVWGMTDGRDAVKQAILLCLGSERYRHVIFSWNYGVELAGLFGEPRHYAIGELRRRISEALLWDERITSVENFDFEPDENTVHVTFTAKTIYGDIDIETEAHV